MITGIEVLKFGVEDKAEAIKFLSDFGLSKQTTDIEDTELFQTQNGSKIYLFDMQIHGYLLRLKMVQPFVK
jgi:hypothetical protein